MAAGALTLVLLSLPALAAKDENAELNRDYRTFYSDGRVDYGNIHDSYKADIGIVWTTEIIEAKKRNRKIDGVAIPAPLNKGGKVGYAIGVLNTGSNTVNGSHYVGYLATDAAQNIYAKYGFVKANKEELKLRPIPAPKEK